MPRNVQTVHFRESAERTGVSRCAGILLWDVLRRGLAVREVWKTMTEFMVRGMKVGNVERFRPRFMEALIHLDLSLRVGDLVQIVGPETDFRQQIDVVRVHLDEVKRGKPGQRVWVPVQERVRPGDAVVVIPPDGAAPPARDPQ